VPRVLQHRAKAQLGGDDGRASYEHNAAQPA
jgi:hypothetical protein